MAFSDRLKGFAASAFNYGASKFVPGMRNPSLTGNIAVDKDEQTVKAIRSADAMFGRVSYGAGPTFTRYSSYPASGISPERITAILKECDNGNPLRKAELDEQVLERDAHLGGIDYARKVEVSGKPFRVQARNETPVALSIAKFVRSVVDEIDAFDQGLEDLLGASGRGYSVSEIIWKFDDVRFPDLNGKPIKAQVLRPCSLEYVHQKHFRFDLVTDEPYLLIGNGEVSLPPWKFVFHSAAGTGIVERRGYMRSVVWLHAAKQWSMRDWLVYEHLYGLPQIEGIYDSDIALQDTHRTIYEKILQDFGQGIPAIHPRDFEVKITPPPSGGKSDDVHGAIIGMCNAEMSKRVQGETLTTEMGGTGSYNASETHADTKHAFIRGDARKLGHTIRRELFHAILELNAGTLARALGVNEEEIMDVVPFMIWRIDRETNPEARARIISMAINEWGMSVDEDQTRDEFGIDHPKSGSEPLAGAALKVTRGGKLVGSLGASQDGAAAPIETPPANLGAVPKEPITPPSEDKENTPKKKGMRKNVKRISRT